MFNRTKTGPNARGGPGTAATPPRHAYLPPGRFDSRARDREPPATRPKRTYHAGNSSPQSTSGANSPARLPSVERPAPDETETPPRARAARAAAALAARPATRAWDGRARRRRSSTRAPRRHVPHRGEPHDRGRRPPPPRQLEANDRRPPKPRGKADRGRASRPSARRRPAKRQWTQRRSCSRRRSLRPERGMLLPCGDDVAKLPLGEAPL